MKKMLAMSTFMVAAALLLNGCTNAPEPVGPASEAPLVSTAEGLGEPKEVQLLVTSPFNPVNESTQRKIDFKMLERLDWKVERVLKAADGEKLPAGDNFKATASSNPSYTGVVKEWVETMKADGWTATNEVKAQPRPDEAKYEGTKEDYRAKAYSVDLAKGKSTIKINSSHVDNSEMTMIINSQ
jgi:hypothetical protein